MAFFQIPRSFSPVSIKQGSSGSELEPEGSARKGVICNDSCPAPGIPVRGRAWPGGGLRRRILSVTTDALTIFPRGVGGVQAWGTYDIQLSISHPAKLVLVLRARMWHTS